ncbi:hypothetical protein AOLI_G00158390 [Acnodon oligacanthus]
MKLQSIYCIKEQNHTVVRRALPLTLDLKQHQLIHLVNLNGLKLTDSALYYCAHRVDPVIQSSLEAVQKLIPLLQHDISEPQTQIETNTCYWNK